MHLPLGDPVIDCSSISEPCYPSVSEVLTDLQCRSTLWALWWLLTMLLPSWKLLSVCRKITYRQ